MATRLRIRSLTITTASHERTYRFADDLTVISGPVATGKSTLLMLIKYAFGGSAVLTPAVKENVQLVTLDVKVDDNPLLLRRNVAGDRTRVHIFEPGSDVPQTILSIPSRKDETTTSRYLLEGLGIHAHRVPKSRGRRKSEFTTVGFGDVFGYCYLQAKTIDSSATGHHDSSRDAKRMTVFEILFGIINPEAFALREERDKLVEQIGTQDRSWRAIRDFLKTSGHSTLEALRTERWNVQDQLLRSQRAVEDLRTDVEALVRRDQEQRDQLLVALSRAVAAREAAALARETVRAREAALAQLKLDLAHLDKAALAANLLSPFEFVTCPRCLQDLERRTVHAGECLLCRQPEPDASAEEDDGRRTRLTAQVVETETLLHTESADAEEREYRSAAAELEAMDAQRHYDELTRGAASPRMQAIADVSTVTEGLRRQLEAIDQRIATWRVLEKHEEAIVRLKTRKRELDDRIKDLEGQLESRTERLEEISRFFAQEVDLIGVEVNGRPTINPRTYLPMIGGTDLEELQASGGGSTTAINVAFSLALFNYAVQNPDVLLPNLLILDSPRKGIGRTEREDQELADRVYRRLRTLAQALAGRGQIIVADNDAELGDERDVTLIPLTQLESAVPGVANTGVGTAAKVEDLDEEEQ